MDTSENIASVRQVALYALAVIGFVAFVGGSMWLAEYSTRYVPGVVNRIGGAAVYLGSIFTPSTTPALSVVPTPIASTTTSAGTLSSSSISSNVNSSTQKIAAPTPSKAIPTTPGNETSGVYPINATTAVNSPLSGLPHFSVDITAIGYLATTSADSFVATSTVPANSRPAVTFTIKNIGTNATGPWRFSATIPTQTAYIYQSQPQQSLNPGDSIDYTLGFDQADAGANQLITITANFDHAVIESSSNNDTASATITILGN